MALVTDTWMLIKWPKPYQPRGTTSTNLFQPQRLPHWYLPNSISFAIRYPGKIPTADTPPFPRWRTMRRLRRNSSKRSQRPPLPSPRRICWAAFSITPTPASIHARAVTKWWPAPITLWHSSNHNNRHIIKCPFTTTSTIAEDTIRICRELLDGLPSIMCRMCHRHHQTARVALIRLADREWQQFRKWLVFKGIQRLFSYIYTHTVYSLS